MPRRDSRDAKRRDFIPIVARCFAEVGYRRATTAVLAKRCGVRENILYRLWPGKKAMFIAAIAHVYETSADAWSRLAARGSGTRSAADRILEYEARHLGEFGLARLVFAGLTEADDPDIRAALGRMYDRYQDHLRERIAAHRAKDPAGRRPDPSLAAWAVIGLGTAALIGRELGLLDGAQRQRLLSGAGRLMLDGAHP